MSTFSIHRALMPLAAAAALLCGAPAQAFTSLTVFGDSLSDSGNNATIGLFDPSQAVTDNRYVPSFAYGPAGTYSNGPVWATTFAGMLGLPLAPSFAGGTNFAAGGATTGTNGPIGLPDPPFPPGLTYPYSLMTQSALYLAATGGAADPNGLYVVAGGGNNARAALEDPLLFVPGTIGDYATDFAADIGAIVDALQAAGAMNIVVWNVPNLAGAPAVLADPSPLAPFAAGLVVDEMNKELGLELAGEAGVRIFDIHGLLSDPAVAALFTNTTDACGAAAIGTDCSTYAFWDGIHPTTAAHDAIAYQMAAAVPEPETYALMALGLVAVGFAARRRKALPA